MLNLFQVIDINTSSKICSQCLNQLNNAIKFKNVCLKSDQIIRKRMFEDEEKLWNKNLIALQCNTLNEEIKIDVKCEPLINDSDNDQIDIQGLRDWYDEEEEEPVKRRSKRRPTFKTLNCDVCN